MNIAQLVQFIHGAKHFRDIKPGVLFFQNSRVVEEGTEITAGDEIHGEVDIGRILEGVEKSDEPGRVGRGEDVSFG